jgi:hypothetical protein
VPQRHVYYAVLRLVLAGDLATDFLVLVLATPIVAAETASDTPGDTTRVGVVDSVRFTATTSRTEAEGGGGHDAEEEEEEEEEGRGRTGETPVVVCACRVVRLEGEAGSGELATSVRAAVPVDVLRTAAEGSEEESFTAAWALLPPPMPLPISLLLLLLL